MTPQFTLEVHYDVQKDRILEITYKGENIITGWEYKIGESKAHLKITHADYEKIKSDTNSYPTELRNIMLYHDIEKWNFKEGLSNELKECGIEIK